MASPPPFFIAGDLVVWAESNHGRLTLGMVDGKLVVWCPDAPARPRPTVFHRNTMIEMKAEEKVRQERRKKGQAT